MVQEEELVITNKVVAGIDDSVAAPIRLLALGDVRLNISSNDGFELYRAENATEINTAIKMYQPRAILEDDTQDSLLREQEIPNPIISCKLSKDFNITEHYDLLDCLSKPVSLGDLRETLSPLDGIETAIVIDDDPNFGQMIERFLHTIDQNITVARSLDGYDALKKMQNHPPNLALIDLVLPELNGIEIIEIMRSTRILEDTIILLLTAHNYGTDFKPAEFSQFTVTLPDNNFPLEVFDCIRATSRVLKQRYM